MRVLLTLHHRLDEDSGAPGACLSLGRALEGNGCQVEYADYGRLFGNDSRGSVKEALAFPWAMAAFLYRGANRFDVIDATTGDAWLWGSLGRPGSTSRQILIARSHGLEHVAYKALRCFAAAQKLDLTWRFPIYHGGYRLWEVRRSVAVSDHLIVTNPIDQMFAIQRFDLAPERVTILPNAVGEHFFHLPEVANEDPPHDGLRLAFVGSWIPRKGIRTLVDALSRLWEWGVPFQISLLGTGIEDSEVLGQFAPQIHGRIHAVRSYKNQDLPTLLSGQDVVVFPSLSEGFSVGLAEAMACALVPVATDVGGASMLIDDRVNGLLLAEGTAQALAEAVRWLGEHPREMVRMRNAAREAALRYRWDIIAGQTVATYECALRGAGQSRKAGVSVN